MKKLILFIVAIIAIGALFYTKVYIPKSTYEVITPKKGNLTTSVTAIGNVDAKNIYTISPSVSGKIITLTKEEGDFVQKGEILAKIDSVDLNETLQNQIINLKKAKLEVDSLDKNLQALYAQKSFLSKTYKRYKTLLAKKFIDQATYDKTKSDLQNIDAQINSTKFKIKSAKEAILQAEFNIKAIKKKLAQFTIKSPVSGIVITKNATLNQSVMPSNMIYQVVSPKDVWFKAYVDERLLPKIKLNQKATLKLDNEAKVLNAYVVKIAPKTDLVTNEINVYLKFKSDKFYINSQGVATIFTKTYKNVNLIPSSVVVFRGDKSGVWEYRDNKAYFKEINIIAQNDKFVAINGNYQIIVPNENKKPLKDGNKVYINNSK